MEWAPGGARDASGNVGDGMRPRRGRGKIDAVRKAVDHYPGRPEPLPHRRAGAAAALLLCLLLGACGVSPSRPPARDMPAPAAQANDVLIRAIGLVGTPYRYGGNTPFGGFDCSGLIGFVFLDAAGVRLPRTTRELASLDLPKVRRGQLAPGDVVFFGQHGINHAGIYVGEGRFVHAPSTGGTVRLDSIEGPYWRDTFQFGRRLLN